MQLKGKPFDMQREAQALIYEWARVFNTGRPTDLARFYTQDARIVPPGRPTVVGVEAICTFFGDVLAQGFRDYAVEVADVFAKDASLVASGRWTLRGPGGGLQFYKGNWMNLLAQEDTGRLIAVHMWN
ncbi:ketosteroid isomerase family protein [Bradyrhizobium brasilense]|uniref:YybH family protein n=1 Tax=Bradyrhizobium brasilense TaxID=1419277 RepID=UPI0028775BE1|nr:nuclear transport factor 2 family protein [Bradyrhizobium brasilense]MCP3418616.1 ketosteroid isomerase family protein [Bradyrhizobium brasilense]